MATIVLLLVQLCIYIYRQLLAHIQKLYPQLRIYMTPAWDSVSKWELQEPMQHRPPVPEPVVRAMAAIGLAWKWTRWTAAKLACFYSMARMGEFLRVKRKEVLTPRDLLHCENIIYIRFMTPKSRRRGAKVQYSTVVEPCVVDFLCKVWDELEPEELLYTGSQGAFRSRWDAILMKLQIGREHRLTPGGLRGGGAASLHRKGLGLSELMWRMRLQHAQTLGYYLQETAAVSLLPSLPKPVRHRIHVLQEVFPHFLT